MTESDLILHDLIPHDLIPHDLTLQTLLEMHQLSGMPLPDIVWTALALHGGPLLAQALTEAAARKDQLPWTPLCLQLSAHDRHQVVTQIHTELLPDFQRLRHYRRAVRKPAESALLRTLNRSGQADLPFLLELMDTLAPEIAQIQEEPAYELIHDLLAQLQDSEADEDHVGTAELLRLFGVAMVSTRRRNVSLGCRRMTFESTIGRVIRSRSRLIGPPDLQVNSAHPLTQDLWALAGTLNLQQDGETLTRLSSFVSPDPLLLRLSGRLQPAALPFREALEASSRLKDALSWIVRPEYQGLLTPAEYDEFSWRAQKERWTGWRDLIWQPDWAMGDHLRTLPELKLSVRKWRSVALDHAVEDLTEDLFLELCQDPRMTHPLNQLARNAGDLRARLKEKMT